MRMAEISITISGAEFLVPEENRMRCIWKFAVVLAALVALGVATQPAAARQEKPKADLGIIKGSVKGEDGKPAANVNVRLFQPGMRGRGPATRPAAPQLSQPADDGNNKLPAPPGG